MADYAIPKNGAAYIFYGCLVSQADTKLFKSAPTLAAGDFKVSIDGGAFANLATLPTNTPGTFAVKFSLSAGEMTGDNILVVASDAAGAEWCDQCWNIQTAPRGIADLTYPTVSGRSLDVSAGGEAGIDWANIGSPTTVQNLSATNIDVDQVVASVSGAVGSVTGAVGSVTGAVGSVTGAVGSVTGNVGGNVVGSVGTVNAIAANAITAAATAADFGAEMATAIWTDTTAGDFTVAASIGKSVMNGVALGTGLTINGYTGNTVQTGDAFARIGVNGAGLTNIDLPNQTMDITGSISGSVGSVTGAVGSVTGNVGGNVVGSVGTVNALAANVITAASMAADASAEIADAVWDEALAGHLGVGSTGEALNAAGAAGDPWTTALPGAYGAGSAGNIIGNNINAPIATIDTVVDAIKAKTDSLTFTVANKVDSNVKSVNDVTIVGDGSGTPFNV